MIKFPHNLELERSILAGILLSEDGIEIARDIIGYKDFYLRNHQVIFWAVEKGGDFARTIVKNLKNVNKAYFLGYLLDTPVPRSLKAACDDLKDLSHKRSRIKELMGELKGMGVI